MATPPIPPRPVSYVSSAATDGEDQINDDKSSSKRPEKPMPAKKPVPAKKPSLPAAKSTETEDSPPPKPLRKSQSLAKQQSDDAIVSSAPPKPTRPRSTYEPDKSNKTTVPPRPTRPPGVKAPAHKPVVVAPKETSSKPSSEPASTRPMITVISAKPMKSDSIPPPEAGDDVKAKEKPIKPAKPARPPLMKHKDEDKVPEDTVEDLKLGTKQQSSLERPVVKKRTSQEKVPEYTVEKEDETKTSPVPLKRKKPDVKLSPPNSVPHEVTTKVREGRKLPPPRPSYSIDDAKKHKSSSEEPPSHIGSEDQLISKPVARSRTLSASKNHKPPPPKPSQPLTSSATKAPHEIPASETNKTMHNVPDDTREATKTEHDIKDDVSEPPSKPTISKRMSLPKTKTVTDQDVPTINESDSKESTAKLPTTRPRTHSGGAKHRPPKPAPPKLPPPKPAPPKSHKPNNLPDDKHNQEYMPSEKLQEAPKALPGADKNVPFSGKPESEISNNDGITQIESHAVGRPRADSGARHPPKPMSPKPVSFKSHKVNIPATDKDDDKDLIRKESLENKDPVVSEDDDKSVNAVSDHSSEQMTEIQEPERPAISKRSSSRKWKPPMARKQDKVTMEKEGVKSSDERIETQEETSSGDQPPPRPLPPKDDFESTNETTVKTPLPPQAMNPLPPQAKKPLQVKEVLPLQIEEAEHDKPSHDQTLPVKQEVSDLLRKEEHKKVPPSKPVPSENLRKLSHNTEDQLSRSTPDEAENEKKHKPPRPAMPTAPPIRKTTPELESHLVDEPPPLPKRPTPGHPLYHYVTNNPRGTARFDYHPEDVEELSFLKDNLIELIERVDENWLYGCNVDDDCKEGMVLEKYLKIIKRLPGEDKLNYLKELPSAVAMFDFEGENEDELSFVSGDLIILEEKIDDTWFKGYIKSPQESGIFPVEFVEVVEPLPPSESVSESKSQQVQFPMTTNHSTNAESSLGNKPFCIAESQFISEGPDELSIEPGDKVMLLERINDDWLKGTLKENTGIFPAAFVDIKINLPMLSKQPAYEGMESITVPAEDTTNVAESKLITGKSTGKCKTLFEFVAEQEGELSLNVGDTVITTAWVNDEWLQGICNGIEGIFPVQFVQVLKDLPRDSTLISDKIPKNISAETDLSPRAKAIKDHATSNICELNFKVGDVIYLLNKIDDGKFLEGELNNKVGKFPSSYVEIIVALP